MSDKLGFGLIGLGEIAYKSTGKLFQQAERCRMVVGVDPVEDVAKSYEETFEIPCSTELDDVLNHPEVGAVIVSTPHFLHAPLGIEAAKRGKHVIVEKPMATTMEDADALLVACRENNVLCSAKEGAVRYYQAALKAKALVEEGAIGEVMAVQIQGASNKPLSYWTGGYSNRVHTTWRMSKEQSGGGILIMNYIYDIHRMMFITGLDVKRVFTEMDTFRTDAEIEDFITVTLRFNNGALGTIVASSCVPGAKAVGIRGTALSGNRIFGTGGQIVFNRGELLVFTEKDVEGLTKDEWTTLTFDADLYPFLEYIDRFSLSAMEGRPAEVPGEEGRKTLEVLVAAYRSGEEHRPIELPL
ncbi:MAG: Gfo/Idh/MocA family oxidoreductase [Candidatus Latescibacteria bacterium]|nr:Gfo/Idh/MocA family oxidoreductase [Candidatus Latescibacterota bacterium]